MTSVVVWCGVDSRAPSSLYVATDSRISWPGTDASWDQARKTFACTERPLILGYWGDVLFPLLVLPTVLERSSFGGYDDLSPEQLHRTIAATVRTQWRKYPAEHRADVGIVVGSRSGLGLNSKFLVSIQSYSSKQHDWQLRMMTMPTVSSTLRVAGSGATEVRAALELWNSGSAANTSRAVFSAFCEAVASEGDPRSGGAPQLVGLYRRGNGRAFGVLSQRQRYLSGADVTTDEQRRLTGVDWFNELFERVNPASRGRLSDAQVHLPRGRTLK